VTYHEESFATMSLSFPRLFAAILLAVGAVATALIAFGLAVADVVISTGRFVVPPADAATLDSLASGAVPLGLFAVFGVVAAIALVLGTPHSKALALIVAGTGVAIGVAALAALLLASGPFATMPSTRVLDGIEMIGAFALIHLVAFIAVLFDRQGARAAGPAVVG
jgi:hypothetical protein